MTTRKPRFAERLTLPVRPQMRQDVERIAAELDVPATEFLRDWPAPITSPFEPLA